MPQYTIPPWIRGPEIAQNYARGFGLGQQGAEAQSRLALAQMQLAAEQARHERDFTYRQQEIEMQRALEEQRMNLQKQEFDQRMQENQAQLQLQQQQFQAKQAETARLAAARMAFQKDYEEELANDGNGTKAILKWGPMIGGQAAAESAAIRSMMAKRIEAPDSVKGIPVMGEDGKPIPGVFSTMNAQGIPQIHSIPRFGMEEGQKSLEQHRNFDETYKSAQMLGKQITEKYGPHAARFGQMDPSKVSAKDKPLYESWKNDTDELKGLVGELKKLRASTPQISPPGPSTSGAGVPIIPPGSAESQFNAMKARLSALPGSPAAPTNAPTIIKIGRDASGKFALPAALQPPTDRTETGETSPDEEEKPPTED